MAWLRQVYLAPKALCLSIQGNLKVQGGVLEAVQPVLLMGQGRIEVSGKSFIGYFPSPAYFSSYGHLEARRSTARISIGNKTHINNAFTAIAEHTLISIGGNCRIGPNTTILDSDFHGLTLSTRSISKPEMAKPVIIEDDVFIGANVLILKGTRIGQGSVIAAGSVVVGNIPPNVIAGGNPCRIISDINSNDE